VLRRVHAQQFLARRVPGDDQLQSRLEAFTPQAIPKGGQPLRPLRVTRPRVVLEEHGIVVEPDLQCRERSSLAAAESLGRTSNTSPTIP